jgi:hypothetical protein
MPFVNVNLVAPDMVRYTVDIDPQLGVESVKGQLLRELGLENSDKKYSLYLVDSFALSNGDEVQLVETKMLGVKGLKKQADGTQ